MRIGPHIALMLIPPIAVAGFFVFRIMTQDDNIDDVFISTYQDTKEFVKEYSPQHISVYEREEEEKDLDTATIRFVGDIFFDRAIRKVAERESYDFILDEIRDQLSGTDLLVGNLEGPVTTHPSKTNENMFTFTFDPQVLDTLVGADFDIVSIDNNHVLNFGTEGLNQTKEHFASSPLQYFGNPYDRHVEYITRNNIVFGFVSYNQFLPDTTKTLELIKEAHGTADWVVVFPHWGDEYKLVPNIFQQNLAHQFVDAGADFVIGAHPHVVQSKEQYKNAWIYYSLGNFVFDQYFQEDVRCGAIVTFTVDDSEIISIDESFSYLKNNGQTIPKRCLSEVPVL